MLIAIYAAVTTMIVVLQAALIKSLLRKKSFGVWNESALKLVGVVLELLQMDLVAFDIDYLHQCNDKWGYRVVDLLVWQSLRFRKGLRGSREFIFLRFSGDEFICFMPAGSGLGFAQRLQKSMRSSGKALGEMAGNGERDDVHDALSSAGLSHSQMSGVGLAATFLVVRNGAMSYMEAIEKVKQLKSAGKRGCIEAVGVENGELVIERSMPAALDA